MGAPPPRQASRPEASPAHGLTQVLGSDSDQRKLVDTRIQRTVTCLKEFVSKSQSSAVGGKKTDVTNRSAKFGEASTARLKEDGEWHGNGIQNLVAQ